MNIKFDKRTFLPSIFLSPPIVIPNSKVFLSGFLCLRRGRDVVAAAMALFFAAPQARADVGEGGVQERRCVETSYFHIFLHGIGSIYLHEWLQFLVNVGVHIRVSWEQMAISGPIYSWYDVDGNQKSGIHSPVEVGTSSWNPIIYKVFAPSQVSAPSTLVFQIPCE